LHDLEDAAAEWVLAPATSLTLLNSFYTLFDFLPPSNPPPASYPIPVPDKVIVEEPVRPKTLSKNNKGSMASLRSFARRKKLGSNRENGERNVSESDNSRLAQSTATSSSTKATAATKCEKVSSFNDWSVVKLVEQYDPEDMQVVSQPYAYVADYMVEVKLSASLGEEIAKYEAWVKENEMPSSNIPSPTSPGTPSTPNAVHSGDLSHSSARDVRMSSRQLGWFEKLRDGLQKGEEIGWYVVVCGDEERMTLSMELARSSTRNESESGSESESEDSVLIRTHKSGTLKGLFKGKKKTAGE
jgi:hypothetical protein